VILYFLLLYAGVDFSKRCTTLLFLLAKLVVDLIFRLFTCLFALIALDESVFFSTVAHFTTLNSWNKSGSYCSVCLLMHLSSS